MKKKMKKIKKNKFDMGKVKKMVLVVGTYKMDGIDYSYNFGVFKDEKQAMKQIARGQPNDSYKFFECIFTGKKVKLKSELIEL